MHSITGIILFTVYVFFYCCLHANAVVDCEILVEELVLICDSPKE